jgi:hypothetical protein
MKILAIVLIALVASVGIGSAAPADVAGWDTPYDRCLVNMELYEEKLDLLDNYTGRAMGLQAFRDFYYNYYNTKTMKYAYMYDRILTYGI